MKKKIKKICLNCLFWSIIVIVLITLLFYFIEQDECKGITDTSMKANCYTDLAESSGDLSYCENYPYYFDECLDFADPQREADENILNSICDANTDSSRKENCYEYIEENY